MNKTPSIGIIIPARLASKRLSEKVLIDIHGIPMIEHVRRRALLSSLSENVIVASGDRPILERIKKYGGQTSMSLEEHMNGLSRAAEAAQNFSYTHLIILQGDEVLILPEQIDSLCAAIYSNPEINFWNGICDLKSEEDLQEPSVVKCTMRQDGGVQTLFRRSPLTSSSETQLRLIKKICGLFAISAQLLRQFRFLDATPLEESESIEQLRLLEHSLEIGTFDMKFDFPSVNIARDLSLVENVLNNNEIQRAVLKRILSLELS